MFSPLNDIRADFIAPGNVLSMEPVRTNHFFVFFNNIPKDTSYAPMSGDINRSRQGFLPSERGVLFTRAMLTGPEPSWSVQTQSVGYFDEVAIFPVSHDRDKTISMVLYDYGDQPVADSLWEWANNIFVVTPFKSRSTSRNPDRLRFKSSYHYKSDIELVVYSTNGVRLRTFIFRDGYPIDIKFGTFSYDGSDANKIDVTFAYSYMDYRSEGFTS